MAKPVEVDASCVESWKELTDAKTETNWVLWGFEGNVLKPVGQGTGGLAEIVTKFEDTQVLFGGLKVVGVDQRENVVSRRPKFIAITWKGPNVPVLKRAAVSIQREQVQKHMQGIAAALDIGAPEELNQKELAKKLLGAGGAHKPTHYEFGPDQLVPIDQLV